MAQSNSQFCFCTAAFGDKYVRLAQLLAADLRQFAPNQPFLIPTDLPERFRNHANVIAVQHWCRGVQAYHERRFALQQALRLADAVMYLDADVRICAPVPALTFAPGLTARSCGELRKHWQEQFERPNLSAGSQRKKQIIEAMARKVDVDLYAPDVKFINEFLFVVTAQAGREQEFLRLWGELAIYADTLGLHQHPTYAMALAAVKSGFPVHHSEMVGLDFFDDRIETIRIRKGQSTPDAKAYYFREQSQIEQAPKTRVGRLLRVGSRRISLAYHRLRVRLIAALFPALLIDYQPRVGQNQRSTALPSS
ncbi:MAG: hypothetical protein EDM05_56000 [Leptolyngbya sp. IPPAS B-1204]